MDEEDEEEELYEEIIDEDSDYAEDFAYCVEEYPEDKETKDEDLNDSDSDSPDTDRDEHHAPVYLHAGHTDRQPKIGIAEGIYGFVFVIAMLLFFIFFL